MTGLQICGSAAMAQVIGNVQPYTGETYSLDGVVINAVTSEPIPRALVQGPAEPQLTNSEGKFHFTKIPPGQYTVIPSKPGFFTEDEIRRRSLPGGSIQIGPGLQPLVLKLTPASVIYGRVTADHSEPMENLRVRAMVMRMQNGQRAWAAASGREATDDEGRFRIAGLRPGVYYLEILPGGAAAVRQPIAPGTRREGYAPTFYPGTRDFDSAAQIRLEAGQEYEADFAISLAPVYNLRGTLIGLPSGVTGAGLELVSRDGDRVGANYSFDVRTSTFQMDSVPGGTYVLSAFIQSTGTPEQYMGKMPLVVNGDELNIRLSVSPTATILLTVRNECTRHTFSENEQLIGAQFISTNMGSGGGSFWAEAEGPPGAHVFVLRNVQPGAYRAFLNTNGDWYIVSARSGPVDLLKDDLVVGAGSSVDPIEVVVRDDSASLSGVITSHGQPIDGVAIVSPVGAPRMTRPVYADSSGRFQMDTLAPGDYRMIALENLDEAFQTVSGPILLDPDSSFAAAIGIQTIHLDPNQQATVKLELQRKTK